MPSAIETAWKRENTALTNRLLRATEWNARWKSWAKKRWRGIAAKDRLRAELDKTREDLADEMERHQGTLGLLIGHDKAFERVMDERDMWKRTAEDRERERNTAREGRDAALLRMDRAKRWSAAWKRLAQNTVAEFGALHAAYQVMTNTLRDTEIKLASTRRMLSMAGHTHPCSMRYLKHMETGTPFECTCECGQELRDAKARALALQEELTAARRVLDVARKDAVKAWGVVAELDDELHNGSGRGRP